MGALLPGSKPPLLGRFDSNASASSSSNEGDSDRDEKKRKQLKKAKMAKDRKSRKKPVEVHTQNGRVVGSHSLYLFLSITSRACQVVLLGLLCVASEYDLEEYLGNFSLWPLD